MEKGGSVVIFKGRRWIYDWMNHSNAVFFPTKFVAKIPPFGFDAAEWNGTNLHEIIAGGHILGPNSSVEIIIYLEMPSETRHNVAVNVRCNDYRKFIAK